MDNLREYVMENGIRGDCTCGRCIDALANCKQPTGHTENLIFFKVAKRKEVNKDTFLRLIEQDFPHWLDGKEHSYIQIGADIGDQGLALLTMGLGSLLGIWKLQTPESITPFLPQEMKMKMAQSGLITIIRPK